ncbi:MAG: hypothetical protein GX207_11395 [Peptococcaceae bacterium]|nr:hypothetical protein [Peptococcaceae bacterium]
MLVGRTLIRNLSIILAVLIAVVGLTSAVALVKPRSLAEQVSAGNALDKLKSTVQQGGIVEFSAAEINSLVGLWVARTQKENLDPTKINIQLGENDLIVSSLILPKENVNLVFTAQGQLFIQEGDLVFLPKAFKLGNVLLPQSFVLNRLANYSGLAVKSGKIIISKEYLPFSIEAIGINQGRMIIEFRGEQVK